MAATLTPSKDTVKEVKTLLWRDRYRNVYRVFIIFFHDGTGQTFKFMIEDKDGNSMVDSSGGII